jgi:hypothetical protein
MLRLRWAYLFISLVTTPAALHAQFIKGLVCDSAGVPLEHVLVLNIHKGTTLYTAADGQFQIGVKGDELLEFRKLGYKTARVRVNPGAQPSLYKVVMHAGIELKEVEVHGGFKDYQHDSAYYEAYFKKQIHITSKDLERFRYEYNRLDQMKYVDYHFNEKLIVFITGLKGDSALAYMQQYRPSYKAFRAMSEYDQLVYIDKTVSAWRAERRFGQRSGVK